MSSLKGRVLLTGGSGTLGKAIIKRAIQDGWDCQLVVFSTDSMKHLKIKKEFPKVQFIVGDVRDTTTLYNAMVGCDYVLHLAAVKHIPESEYNSIDTFEVNVTGSINVCAAAHQLRVPHVLGISTDKACGPANAYGASKMMMEKCFQEYARLNSDTQFHLVRYGNVLESTGSVIESWKNAMARGDKVKITDEHMTRFWLSPSQAVDYVMAALECESGFIYVPKMPALSIGQLLKYTVLEGYDKEKHHFALEKIPLRPGEKMHETLVTREELTRTIEGKDEFGIRPSTQHLDGYERTPTEPYTSDVAHELTPWELQELLEQG